MEVKNVHTLVDNVVLKHRRQPFHTVPGSVGEYILMLREAVDNSASSWAYMGDALVLEYILRIAAFAQMCLEDYGEKLPTDITKDL